MIEADRRLTPKWEGTEDTNEVGRSCINEQAGLKTRRQVRVPKRDRRQTNSQREI
ncbi:hypothetical protein LC653_38750 [Nostoc sp. CHAB 5784]|uniref:hypothetical protein n=1 Tax=Nostoc mirabile TaxID=2907820 RepID=UPI001E560962|nr:hypothetical protein [Nostoc mirabile]MCC5669602.1 hypothetical protein [Nostoc mirabile CHAB5784]